MRILPVLDVLRGQAVHAVAGNRQQYQPLSSRFAEGSSDPLTLARGLRDAGVTELYLADLDAIISGAGPDHRLYRGIADLNLRLWVDPGPFTAGADIAQLIQTGLTMVVVGLESGVGPRELEQIVAQAGTGRVAWSLDLRNGVPIVPPGSEWAGNPLDPANLVNQAVSAGVRRIIRLDLARVGTGRGVNHFPVVDPGRGIAWWAGGGVRGPTDLACLAERGYTGALVGTALHDGRIGLHGSKGADSQGFNDHRTS